MLSLNVTMKQLFIILLVTICHQESIIFASKDCISTVHEFQHSLVNRSVNLDSLQTAFSPPNHQTSVSFVVHYHFCSHVPSSEGTTLCSEIEDWINGMNAGLIQVEEFREKYEAHHQFRWNASPIGLFIRPQLLELLSLFTFRITEGQTHIVLDQCCENLIGSFKSPNEDTCKNPPPVLTQLEKVTANVSKLVVWYMV